MSRNGLQRTKRITGNRRMKLVMRSILSAAACIALMGGPAAEATVIYDAIAGDSTNSYTNSGTPGTITAGTDSLTLQAAGGGFFAHFGSASDIQTLNGGTLLSTDVIKITWVVDSFSTGADLDANGAVIALLPDAAFRAGPTVNVGTITRLRGEKASVVNSERIGYGFGNIWTTGGKQTEAEPTVEGGASTYEVAEESLLDGFTVVQTISAAGVTTQFSDVVVKNLAGTVQDYTTLTTVLEPLPDTIDFVSFFNGTHFYAGVDLVGSGSVTFSQATIEIVPEPSSIALLGLGGLLVARRRRR